MLGDIDRARANALVGGRTDAAAGDEAACVRAVAQGQAAAGLLLGMRPKNAA